MLIVLTSDFRKYGLPSTSRKFCRPDEVALAAEQAPVEDRDVGGVDEREEPDDGEQHEERRDVEVGRELDVEDRQPLPAGQRRAAERRRSLRAAGVGVHGASAGSPAGRWAGRLGGRRCRGRGGVPTPGRGVETMSHVGRSVGGVDQDSWSTSDRNVAQDSSGEFELVVDPQDGGLEGLQDVGVLRALVGLHGDRLGPVGEDLPVGASLKNALVASRTSGESSASTWLGKAPMAAKALACCSGAVIQAANSLASSGWSRLRGNGQEGAAPVAAAAGEGVGDVPAVDAVGVALDDAQHPAGAGHRGEPVVLEGRGPVVAQLREAGREALVHVGGHGAPDLGEAVVVESMVPSSVLEGVGDLVEHRLRGARRSSRTTRCRASSRRTSRRVAK